MSSGNSNRQGESKNDSATEAMIEAKKTKDNNFLELSDRRKGPSLVVVQEPPKIGPVPPPTALLSRLSAFLPEMERANKELQERVAAGESVDLEDLDETQESHIALVLTIPLMKILPIMLIPCIQRTWILESLMWL